MENELKTYYDFAENDYRFLLSAYENGLVGNIMGAMAQEICEKYLKHIIDQYTEPATLEEHSLKSEVLKTHNLNKLAKYISKHVPDMKMNKAALNTINGLYFTTRYPGDESILIEKDDIPEFIDAVKECKASVDDFIRNVKKG